MGVKATRATAQWLSHALGAQAGGTVGDSRVRWRMPSVPTPLFIGINQYSAEQLLGVIAA